MRRRQESAGHGELVLEGKNTRDRRSMSDTMAFSLTSCQNPSLKGGLGQNYRVGKVLCTGWLNKEGHVWKNWKRRYFILQTKINIVNGATHGILQYFKHSKDGKLKGEVILTDASVKIEYLDIQRSKRPYCFRVVKGFYTLICQGKNEQEVAQWIQQLTAMVAPGSVRGHAITDLYGQNVAAEIRKLLENHKSPPGAKCAAFVKGFDAKSLGAVEYLQRFVVEITNMVLEKHAHSFVKVMNSQFSCEEKAHLAVRKLTRRQVEENIFLPLHDRIYASLRKKVSASEEHWLNKKMQWLQGKEQRFFNIPVYQLSNDKWRFAVVTLMQMGSHSLPSDKLEALIQTIDRIKQTYMKNHPLAEQNLTTDDLLPIFTFVLVNTATENVLTLQALLQAMCSAHQDAQHITGIEIFTAAIQYITNVSIPAVLEDIFNDQISVSIDGQWNHGVEIELESNFRCGASIKYVTFQGYSVFGHAISKGYVLVSVAGTNVVLWPYLEIVQLLNNSVPPLRLAFISPNNYVRILSHNKRLWNDALLASVCKGVVSDTQLLLANGANINCQDEHGNSPLHLACAHCQLDMVYYLLQTGARADFKGQNGRTPMHVVGSINFDTTTNIISKICKRLVSHGGLINVLDDFGFSPLMCLARRGCTTGIQWLVTQKAGVNIRNWQHGYTALSFASSEGNIESVRMLLQGGADPNIDSLLGESPLHIAANNANAQTCKLLLDYNASIDARRVDGLTPLMLAVCKGKLGFERRFDVEHCHVDSNSVLETIQILLKFGADKKGYSKEQKKVMHYVAMHGGMDVLKLVISLGFNIAAVDSMGKNALDLIETPSDNEVSSIERKSTSINYAEISELLATAVERTTHPVCLTSIKLGKGKLIASGEVSDIVEYVFDAQHFRYIEARQILYAGRKVISNDVILNFLKEQQLNNLHSNDVPRIARCSLFIYDMWIEVLRTSLINERVLVKTICALASNAISLIDASDFSFKSWIKHSSIQAAIKDIDLNNTNSFFFAGPCNKEYKQLGLHDALMVQNNLPKTFNEDRIRRLSIAGVQVSPNAPPSSARLRSKSALDRVGRLWLLDNEPILIAQQLTILQHWRFQAVPVFRVLFACKSNSTFDELALCKELHNQVSLWIVNQILSRDDVSERAMVLGHCIRIAEKCFSPMQNFDGFMAIMNGLLDSSIFRLKLTWSRITEDARQLWAMLQTHVERGARSLNKVLCEAQPPAVPYVGLLLQNVLALQEYPDFEDDNRINFAKIRSLAKVAETIVKFQSCPYLLQSKSQIADNIQASLLFDNKEKCFQKSLEIEKRIGSTLK